MIALSREKEIKKALFYCLLTWSLSGFCYQTFNAYLYNKGENTLIEKHIPSSTTSPVAECDRIDWATWNSSDFTGQKAIGKIQDGNDLIRITMESNFSFSSTPGIYTHSKFNGYPYPIPDGTVPMTEWAAGMGGITKMCFSQTVTNPVLLIASLGNSQGLQAQLNFSLPYVVLFDGGNMVYNNSTTLTGTEGYAIIMFPGDFTCVTINSNTQEFYTNITWGIRPPPFAINVTELSNTCGEVKVRASEGVSYLWNGGDTPNSQTNTFHQSGTYIVTVTNAEGCKTSVPKEIIVKTAAPVQISEVSKNCDKIVLNASGAESYVWDGGDNPNDATNTFRSSGTYTVTATHSNGCTSTASKTITIEPIQTSISGNLTGCNIVSLTATGGESYVWNGGDTPNSATNTFRSSGTYTVITTHANGCTSTASKTITVNSAETIINGSSFGCNAVSLTAAGGDSYVWSGGGDTPNDATNIFHSSGTYTVTTTHANGCTSTASKTITVGPAQTSISGDLVGCEKVTLTVTGGDSYVWDGGDTPRSATNTFRSSGTYSVLIEDQNGCTSTLSKDVIILGIKEPSIQITSNINQSMCPGTRVLFTAEVFNGGLDPILRWLKNGVHVETGVSYTSESLIDHDEVECELISNLPCISSDKVLSNKIKTSVYTAPQISFKQEIIADKDPVKLNPIIWGDIEKYSWSPVMGLSNPNIKNPIASPSTSTLYRLEVISPTGCKAYSEVRVVILRDNTFPNSFSPNGDHINDTWNVNLLPGADILIYNRFGSKVFQAKGADIKWDGCYEGNPLPFGVYFYLINLNDGSKPIKGSITILH